LEHHTVEMLKVHWLYFVRCEIICSMNTLPLYIITYVTTKFNQSAEANYDTLILGNCPQFVNPNDSDNNQTNRAIYKKARQPKSAQLWTSAKHFCLFLGVFKAQWLKGHNCGYFPTLLVEEDLWRHYVLYFRHNQTPK
jgi:hypothetical protein